MSSEKAALTTKVAVVMGSDSDLATLKPAVEILESFSVKVAVRILSAHRTPLEMVNYAEQAKLNGLKVIIAGAGGAAHLPGMIASLTCVPVIGVPIKSKALSGIDSMHSILQMPRGVPVATVAIDGGLNAGLLAAAILALSDPMLEAKLSTYREEMHDQVTSKDLLLQNLGAAKYLEKMQE